MSIPILILVNIICYWINKDVYRNDRVAIYVGVWELGVLTSGMDKWGESPLLTRRCVDVFKTKDDKALVFSTILAGWILRYKINRQRAINREKGIMENYL